MRPLTAAGRLLTCAMLMGGVTLASGVVTQSSTNAWALELDGHPFIPFGLNRFAVMTLGNNRDDWTTEQYLQQAAARGVNTLRVFVPEPDFEPALGTYEIEQFRRLDQTVQLAEQYGVKLIVCLFDHWVFRNTLATSAYSVHKGGPLESGRAFYTHPVARVHEAQRIRFIVGQYKTSSAILAWEPINELNGGAADYPGQQTYGRLAFLLKLLSQPGPQGPVPTKGGAAYQYGPVVAVFALGGPLRVTLPFDHFTVHAYHPDRHDWSVLPNTALDAQPGTLLLFERTP